MKILADFSNSALTFIGCTTWLMVIAAGLVHSDLARGETTGAVQTLAAVPNESDGISRENEHAANMMSTGTESEYTNTESVSLDGTTIDSPVEHGTASTHVDRAEQSTALPPSTGELGTMFGSRGGDQGTFPPSSAQDPETEVSEKNVEGLATTVYGETMSGFYTTEGGKATTEDGYKGGESTLFLLESSSNTSEPLQSSTSAALNVKGFTSKIPDSDTACKCFVRHPKDPASTQNISFSSQTPEDSDKVRLTGESRNFSDGFLVSRLNETVHMICECSAYGSNGSFRICCLFSNVTEAEFESMYDQGICDDNSTNFLQTGDSICRPLDRSGSFGSTSPMDNFSITAQSTIYGTDAMETTLAETFNGTDAMETTLAKTFNGTDAMETTLSETFNGTDAMGTTLSETFSGTDEMETTLSETFNGTTDTMETTLAASTKRATASTKRATASTKRATASTKRATTTKPPDANDKPYLALIVIAASAFGVLVLLVVALLSILFVRRRPTFFTSSSKRKSDHHGHSNHSFSLALESKDVCESVRPEPIPFDEFLSRLESLHRDSDFLFSSEFSLLQELSPKFPQTAAELDDNRIKNRYSNILPFDHSRVKLIPLDDDDQCSDYINANYMPGFSSKREFIAAQGPMKSTIDDFWRMIWEQNITTIVMVTNLQESGREKCAEYWPMEGEPIFYGDLQVQLKSESQLNYYIIRVMEVKLGEKKRTVRHLHFIAWPDFGCPENTSLLLDFVTGVRSHMSGPSSQNSGSGPILVHCSAGVGRTGTFILIDRLLQHIRSRNVIDLYGLVLEMRNYRCNMIQTESQYVFAYECIRTAIERQTESNSFEEVDDNEDESLYQNVTNKGEILPKEEEFYQNFNQTEMESTDI